MSTSDCYITALHVGIPLLILSWLGHLTIYVIYNLLVRYIDQPQKYFSVHHEQLVIDKHKRKIDNNSSQNSSDELCSSSSEYSPRNQAESVVDTPDHLPRDATLRLEQLPGIKPVVVPAINVQQELASRNLSMTSIQENMMALAPLAKQHLEESKLPESQKQLLLKIMNSMTSMNIMKQDGDSLNSTLTDLLQCRDHINEESSKYNNILDD